MIHPCRIGMKISGDVRRFQSDMYLVSNKRYMSEEDLRRLLSDTIGQMYRWTIYESLDRANVSHGKDDTRLSFEVKARGKQKL